MVSDEMARGLVLLPTRVDHARQMFTVTGEELHRWATAIAKEARLQGRVDAGVRQIQQTVEA